MLSRVAESLYWMARYLERAEDLTRVLAVNFLRACLDARRPATPSAAAGPSCRITGRRGRVLRATSTVATRAR